MTKEKLNELKDKVSVIQDKIRELNPEELEQIFGGDCINTSGNMFCNVNVNGCSWNGNTNTKNNNGGTFYNNYSSNIPTRIEEVRETIPKEMPLNQ